MNRFQQAAGGAVIGGLGFFLGSLKPAEVVELPPQTVIVRQIETQQIEVPTVKYVYVEREANPVPTDCLVMAWRDK